MNDFFRGLGCFLLLTVTACGAQAGADRVNLFPKLHVGQIIRYQVGYRATTDQSTESNVATPMAPGGGQTNANIVLQVEVEDLRAEAGRELARLRTRIFETDATAANDSMTAGSAPNASGAAKSGASEQTGKTVELTLHGDGHVTDVQGLDALSPAEQAAWREWADRFAGAAAFPPKGVKPGEKWKSDEPVPNALLAGLSWQKESQYVNDAPCAAMKLTRQGDPAVGLQPLETCAVILTTAILRQKSSPNDATPEDYKLHDLRNTGTAQGKNQTISYFSLTTGLLVRSTEDANQSMSVTVSKSDGSNQVHYGIDAESHSRVLLIADASPKQP